MGRRVLQVRHQAIARMRRQLERDGWPRLQMMLLVTITGGAGFVASWALLQGGVEDMWSRYPLALCIAYAFFLLLLWLWLRTRASDWLDGWDGTGLDFGSSRGSGSSGWSGDGGNSGGAGATASFDSPVAEVGAASLDAGESSIDAVTGPIGEAVGAAAEADELAIPLIAVILAISLVVVLALSSLFVVWSAPVLFAELLVDGALAAGLYRRLRGIDSRHWLEAALRRTWLPFLLTALCVAAAGWGMARYAPGAYSIGDVMTQVKATR